MSIFQSILQLAEFRLKVAFSFAARNTFGKYITQKTSLSLLRRFLIFIISWYEIFIPIIERFTITPYIQRSNHILILTLVSYVMWLKSRFCRNVIFFSWKISDKVIMNYLPLMHMHSKTVLVDKKQSMLSPLMSTVFFEFPCSFYHTYAL